MTQEQSEAMGTYLEVPLTGCTLLVLAILGLVIWLGSESIARHCGL